MEPSQARKYPRISVDLPVDYSLESGEDRTRALMMGGGGLFLGVSQSLEPGTIVTIRFRPAKHLPVVEAKARVCYLVAGKGVGIEFTEIAPEHRNFILRLIHHRKGDPRRFPRVPLAAQVQFAEGSLIGFSRDVSTGGMFVETNRALEPGARMNLRFHLEPDEPIVKAEAEVLYEVPRMGIGLQFTKVAPEDLARVRTYVAEKESDAKSRGKRRRP